MLSCAFSRRGPPGGGPPTIQTLPTTVPVAAPPDEAVPPLGALTAPPPPQPHPASSAGQGHPYRNAPPHTTTTLHGSEWFHQHRSGSSPVERRSREVAGTRRMFYRPLSALAHVDHVALGIHPVAHEASPVASILRVAATNRLCALRLGDLPLQGVPRDPALGFPSPATPREERGQDDSCRHAPPHTATTLHGLGRFHQQPPGRGATFRERP
jgi:hypothetical protein